MRNEGSGFGVESKGMLDRRSSKVSSDSLDVKRDVLTKKFANLMLIGQSEDSADNKYIGKNAEQHRKDFDVVRKKVEQEWLPGFKESFVNNLELLRQSGGLDLSPDEVAKKMDKVRVDFFSRYSELAAKVKAPGVNTPFSSVFIELDPYDSRGDENLRPTLQHIYNHEMFHVISGSLFLTTPRHLGIYNTAQHRQGLSFGPKVGTDVESMEKKERFTWLNEAVTENLALSISKDGADDFATYRAERVLLSLLINGPVGEGSVRVDRNKFYQAYFEDYKAEDSDEIRLKKWKELIRSINEAYYPGFLVKIDKLIKEKNIGYVISHFHVLCKDKNTD